MIRLFRVSIPTFIVLLVMTETLLLTACYLVGAWFGLDSSRDTSFYLLYEDGWLKVAVVVLVVQVGLYFYDCYSDFRQRSRMVFVQKLCVVLGSAFLIQAIVGYGQFSILQLPRWTMLYGSGLALLALPAWRAVFFKLIHKALPAENLLFIGCSDAVREIVGRIREQPEMGFSVLGGLSDANGLEGVPHLGAPSQLREVVESQRPSRIVIARGEHRNGLPVQDLLDLRFAGIPIHDAAAFYETVFGRVSVRDLRASQFIFSNDLGPRSASVMLQNIYSFVLGLAGLIVSFPVMAVVAVLVKATTQGPALFRQERVGLHGAHFYLFKFRSMYVDAESNTGPVWASKDDPRITPVGRWIRRFRLDELPQFFNVVRGDMALVGPRPERPEFCEVLNREIPFFHQRHFVKPGITGWAQINHKYADTLEDSVVKLEYDLYYVKNLAPSLDAFIILHTLKVLLLSRGAQ